MNGLFKTECIPTATLHASRYRALADAEFATAGQVNWYSNRRLRG